MKFEIDETKSIDITAEEIRLYRTVNLFMLDLDSKTSLSMTMSKDKAIKLAIEILKQASITEEHTDAFTDDVYQVMAEYVD